jgi:hypothetical protein
MALSQTSLRDISCDRCGTVEVVAVSESSQEQSPRTRLWADQGPELPPPPAGWVRISWKYSNGLLIDLCGKCAAGITLGQVAGMEPRYDTHEVLVTTGRQPGTQHPLGSPSG